MKQILETFRTHGHQASRHYADDTCKEWGSGDKEKAKSLKLFDNHPDLQDEMREIASSFLWSLNMDRPIVEIKPV